MTGQENGYGDYDDDDDDSDDDAAAADDDDELEKTQLIDMPRPGVWSTRCASPNSAKIAQAIRRQLLDAVDRDDVLAVKRACR